MTSADIKTAIENSDFEFHGLRIDDGANIETGDYLDDSRIWINGDPTDETLNGVCTVGIDEDEENAITNALNLIGAYCGDQLILVGGNRREWGEDPGEWIIRDGVAIAVEQI